MEEEIAPRCRASRWICLRASDFAAASPLKTAVWIRSSMFAFMAADFSKAVAGLLGSVLSAECSVLGFSKHSALSTQHYASNGSPTQSSADSASLIQYVTRS